MKRKVDKCDGWSSRHNANNSPPLGKKNNYEGERVSRQDRVTVDVVGETIKRKRIG